MKGSAQPFGSDKIQDIFTRFSPLETEIIPLSKGLGRVLAGGNMRAGEQLPPFARSTMDGFAVRAEDTFACSEHEPVSLEVTGEIMADSPGAVYALSPGQAMRIWTGGELPEKSDGVVMIENTRMGGNGTVEIFCPLTSGENIIRAGEDLAPETIIFSSNKAEKGEEGKKLRPQDLGILSGLGKTELKVHKQVKVGIVSSGDELIQPGSPIEPGKTRDINTITLSALVQETGAVPTCYGIVADNPERLLNICEQVLEENDMLLISGGSSFGKKDFTRQVFENIKNCELLKYGTGVRKGKSTLLAIRDNQALLGLPGHTASSMLIFYLFVRPLIRKLSGLPTDTGLAKISAVTSQPIASTIGREEFIRVSISWHKGMELPVATPVYGKSGLLKPLIQTDGLLVIKKDVERLATNTIVAVLLFP